MRFTSVRFGHAVGAHFGKKVQKTHKKRQNSPSPGCSTGSFITSPSAGQTVQTSEPFVMSWDTSCLDTANVDIYLTSPASSTPVHIWENIKFSPGSYTTNLKPKWYNATSTVSLQLTMVPAGTPQFLSQFPANAPFTAAYTPPASGSQVPEAADTTTPDAIVEDVGNTAKPSSSHISGGAIAAAIIVPLLVIALAVGIYVRFQRQKRNAETRRYSQAIDARMSAVNPDWQAMDPQAQLAMRQSIAAYRMSGPVMNRPASAYPDDGGRAGVGAGAYYEPEMTQSARPDSQYIVTDARASRLSFSPENRVPARAFHQGHVPPQQYRRPSEDLLTSPTQTNGPIALTPDEIRSRVAAADESERETLDDVMPALSIMRTGLEHDALLVAPAPPAAVASVTPKSPLASPAQYASPDDMVRQYAALRSPGSPAIPSPAYNGSNNMRVLYGAQEQGSAQHNDKRASMATVATRYSTDDPYAGMGN